VIRSVEIQPQEGAKGAKSQSGTHWLFLRIFAAIIPFRGQKEI
jgi:hypothetical protein